MLLLRQCRCNPEWTMLPRYSSFASLSSSSKTQTCPCSSKRVGSTIDVDHVDEPLLAASSSSHATTHVGPGPSFTPRSGALDSTPTRTTANDLTHRPSLPPSPHSAPLSHTSSSSTSRRVADYPGIYYANGAADLSGMSFTTQSANSSHAAAASSPETSSLYERNSQFARLISGEESEMGEAPPRYESVILGTPLCGPTNLAGAHAMATTRIVAENR